jgi:sulfate transport system ATP-binding protein
MSITVKDVSKRFGKFTALDRVSVDVPAGCLVALLGPSGSGKTTLLRIIAGLEVPDGGTVHYQDEEVTHRAARDRNVGFVFQHYALFRHMNVFENIAFALRVRRWPQAKVTERVDELLHLIRLEGLGRRMPSELSGGQRQRVALARALAAAPRVLLLDEPFGALDAKVRQELRQWLRRLHDDIGATTIFVTHDQEEAFAVADKVVVMRGGCVEQTGTPQEVFDHPANAFVMDFLGNVNIFHGRAFGNGRLPIPDCRVIGSPAPSTNGHLPSAIPPEAKVYVRPHELDITHVPNGAPGLRAKVLHVNPVGSVTRVELLALDFEIEVHVELSPGRSEELKLVPGETVYVSPRRVRVFVPEYSI